MLSRLNDLENTFALMHELRRRMEHAPWDGFERSWPGTKSSTRTLSGAASWPPVNLFDAGTSLLLTADVPGLADKDVQVTLVDGVITISGERAVSAPAGYAAHRQERGHIKFSRSISLPCKVNPEETTASVKDGVLTITLAKSPEAQPRAIAVRAQ